METKNYDTMKPGFTRYQQYLYLVIIVVMGIDAAISIDGAWNHTATFYEANPIFASFQTVERFTIAVLLLKSLALLLVARIVSALNTLGEHWGDAAMSGGLFSCLMPICVLMVCNIL